MSIKDLPKNERPIERLIEVGASNISNEELLSIILKTGTKSSSVKDLSNMILRKIDNIQDLKDIDFNFFTNIKGIGTVKAVSLIAAIELGKRVNNNLSLNSVNMNNPIEIYNYFHPILKDKKQEYFYCIYLNNKKKLISSKLLFIGTINTSIVHPREIFKEAYKLSSSYIILIHNHPSGDVIPSKEDIAVTNKLIEIGKMHSIPIIEHLIIGYNIYYSFYENNYIY